MMNDALVMIKVINRNSILLDAFKKSYVEDSEEEYEVKAEKDIPTLEKLIDNELFQTDKLIVVFAFSSMEEKYEIEYIYLGTCYVERKEKPIVCYRIKKKIHSQLVIKNILSYSDLDLKNDFEKKSYVNIEYSQALIMQLQELLIEPQNINTAEGKKYVERKEESYLHKYAQYNENCKRVWGREGVQEERSEFQRDRERIVNSKAFRRMVDKAQIFTSSKGDHYRTRMTHTLEVAQIARSIANSLGLNIDLTEAIALGHDIGHTPFGHQGERTLDDIINGKTEVLDKVDGEEKNPYGGFKHNLQSMRMLTKLEEKYVEHPGLDVSYQVLEGILKHTSFTYKECTTCKKEKCKKGCCDFKEFVGQQVEAHLYREKVFATTLEGQVVNLADEIAQRSHDIDDAFSSGLLTFSEFQDYLKLSKMKPLAAIIDETHQKIYSQNERILIDGQEMLTARIISDIIGYLVNDVVIYSRKKMEEYIETDFYRQNHLFDEKLVSFSLIGAEVCSLLDKLISKRAINCLEVTRFDRNAAQIVKYLFKSYYENPKLMHAGTLRRMYIDMLQYTSNVIDFVKGDPDLVKSEFGKIVAYKYPNNRLEWNAVDKEYYQKRKILVRHIVDYIAGMTDSYAINEYQRLR